MNPTELADYLSSNNVALKKSLSQNFLIDKNIRNKILQAAQITSNDVVLEIGPGSGSLTKEILKQQVYVLAIEKDRHFAKALQNMDAENLEVIETDFLTYPLENKLDQLLRLKNKEQIKIIANIPYQITSPILAKILPLFPWIESATLMVQEEVAKRIIAKEGTKTYGRLSIFCQFFSRPTYLFPVSPNCFFPKPKVNSAVVHFALNKPNSRISKEQYPSFFRFIQKAFQSRRKTFINSIKELYPTEKIREVLIKFGISFDVRSEKLSLNDFLSLFINLSPYSTK
ncbi:MAG: 16S rRNA (adenine(1518)-N(6)/adenine(1519)-N(6)) -dimethyltransferase RsmA [Simkaniaceae bacterium]